MPSEVGGGGGGKSLSIIGTTLASNRWLQCGGCSGSSSETSVDAAEGSESCKRKGSVLAWHTAFDFTSSPKLALSSPGPLPHPRLAIVITLRQLHTIASNTQ